MTLRPPRPLELVARRDREPFAVHLPLPASTRVVMCQRERRSARCRVLRPCAIGGALGASLPKAHGSGACVGPSAKEATSRECIREP